VGDNRQMSLLSAPDQQMLREAMQGFTRPVTLLFFSQAIGCETCDEARQILAELPAASDRVTVEEVNLVLEKERAAAYGIDRAPSIVVLSDGEDSRIRFIGSPGGYDFVSLVDGVLLAGGVNEQPLSAESVGLLEGVSEPTHLQVFVTPT